MQPLTVDIKFFEANINHERYGKKKHFFKNRTNAILIDLKNKPQQKIRKYPSLFSLKKFNLLLGMPQNTETNASFPHLMTFINLLKIYVSTRQKMKRKFMI